MSIYDKLASETGVNREAVKRVLHAYGYTPSENEILEELGANAEKWAGAFKEMAENLGHKNMDTGWLIGWFANAIERGRVAHPDTKRDADTINRQVEIIKQLREELRTIRNGSKEADINRAKAYHAASDAWVDYGLKSRPVDQAEPSLGTRFHGPAQSGPAPGTLSTAMGGPRVDPVDLPEAVPADPVIVWEGGSIIDAHGGFVHWGGPTGQ